MNTHHTFDTQTVPFSPVADDYRDDYVDTYMDAQITDRYRTYATAHAFIAALADRGVAAEIWNTGGGCLAVRVGLYDGNYGTGANDRGGVEILAGNGDASLMAMGDGIYASLYVGDGEPLDIIADGDMSAAVNTICNAIPSDAVCRRPAPRHRANA